MYAHRDTARFLEASYRYIFDDSVARVPGTSMPRLDLTPVEPGVPFHAAALEILPLAFEHGHSTVLGYRIGTLAYLTDVKAVPDQARHRLRGLDVLVLNALWWRTHPTHLEHSGRHRHGGRSRSPRTLLTHLTHETGHADLAARLPPGIEPGYDGLTVEIAP